MNIHEYQAKQIFQEYGIPVPSGIVASTANEAVKNAQGLGGDIWVVKAQIHAGGRGLGGGVKVAKVSDKSDTIKRRSYLTYAISRSH